MTKFKLGAAAFIIAAFATAPAFAADVSAPAPSKHSTISIEASPEWSTATGIWADDYLKLGYSYSFDNNFVWGASFQHTFRDASSAEQLESSVGYKLKSGALTITPAVLLGYGFGDQPRINRLIAGEANAYYAFSIAADLKLDDNITWNVISARYRNAFNTTWITPKITTGFTYKFDSSNAIYANVGYAWKDNGNGAGLLGDKWNIAVGYKYSF